MLKSTLALGLILGLSGAAAGQEGEAPATETAPAEQEVKKLGLGDKAPALEIDKWVKGEPIEKFEEGKVYVVEFWATWCGPCIAGMPHVSELQKEYKDEGVRVIGVNIWDEPANVAPFMKERTGRDGSPLPSGDELMDYTVAIEKKGKMAKSWMEGAGLGGIPSAFIVDKESRVAWIGHPMEMDEPLKEVVAGTWDIDEAIAEKARQEQVQAQAEPLIMAFRQAMAAEDVEGQLSAIEDLLALDEEMFAGLKFRKMEIFLKDQGKYEEGYTLATELIDDIFKDNAQALNGIAWTILTEVPEEERNADVALRAAARANELTDNENPSVLDTLAKAYFESGNVEKAIETQELAVEKAQGEAGLLPELQSRLEEYREVKNKG